MKQFQLFGAYKIIYDHESIIHDHRKKQALLTIKQIETKEDCKSQHILSREDNKKVYIPFGWHINVSSEL